ncbi:MULTISPECIES: FliM/FliN family flagellar motor switch protein [unclassified Ochrobactrum]|uniref:FliM/FliN family flagellar motor switch protein n=1 Tax=unclassified Ochrobactrum TaxID=239106 RepID=UPI000DEF88D4|nr:MULTISPECIES: FliM/FliN family flagellar motor switch protein [unclassified Ochrobactrum]MBQ0710478.1 flagellar motor switch protein FliM [Ochrobactrum sp. AP1BH01-1]
MTSPETATLGQNRKTDVLAENVLRAAGLSGDDLKSLAHVFKDASTHFCDRLKHGCAAAFDIEAGQVEGTDDAAFADILDKAAIIAPLKAERWGCTLYLTADATLVFSVIEAMFGAQGNVGSVDEDRPFGMLEQKISALLAGHLASSLDQVFAGNGQALFAAGECIDTAEFDRENFERSRLFACRIDVTAAGKTGRVHLLLPRSTHKPMQDAVAAFLRRPMNQADPSWAKKMRQEVSRALIELEAFIQQGSMTLDALSLLEVGQVLKLPANAMEQVRLRAGNQQLFKCTLGKSGIHFTVKVGDPVNQEEDFIDELVAG